MPVLAEEQPNPRSPRSDASERLLLHAVSRGERAAFEALYVAYHRRLAAFLRRMTQQDELIEEIINDTFWVVWRSASGFRGQSRVSTWIIGIAYRCALKALRRSARGEGEEVGLPEAETEAAAEPFSESSAALELRDWLQRGLDSLPVEQRVTLEMAYYLGLSCKQIAEAMDCAPGTVRTRMFHARIKLRNMLPGLGGSPHESQG